jgi:hypothetical protein
MIKSTVELDNSVKETEHPKYPILKKFTHIDEKSYIVLFTSLDTGFIIYSNAEYLSIGDFNKQCFNEDVFIPLSKDEKVILSNEF